MKEHFLTLFLAVTTIMTLLIFNWTRSAGAIPVFNADEILFEHQTTQGNILITSDPYDELTLSFLRRNINGFTQAGSAYPSNTTLDEVVFLSLPATDTIPFTIHALVSTHPELHQIIVTESGSQIAHGTHQKKTTCKQSTDCKQSVDCLEIAAFLVASPDLTGEDGLILGLDQTGAILLEIEIPSR